MTTGERIKQARIAAGLTQKELADKIGVKFSAIHKYESGIVVNLKRETIASLADALNVKPSWLMCMDDQIDATKVPESEDDEELQEYLEYLRTRPEARILMSTMRGATKEEVEENVRFIEALRKSRNPE